MTRYRVSISAGVKHGMRYGAWDSHSRRVVSWHRTAAQAQAAVRELNRSERSKA